MMNLGYDVAIVGATGVVGRVILEILAERQFPVGKIYALASARSAGEQVNFGERSLTVTDLADFDFSKVQFAFFSAGSQVSETYAPKAAEAGSIVIDNTSFFRYEEDIPLVVPEVNAHALANYRERNIIANPNCSTAQLVVALKPIYDAVGIKHIDVSTYQSVSGAGKNAIEELVTQTAALLNGQPAEVKHLAKQIAFNVIPQIDVFLENGYTKEEMKIVWETQKIFEDYNIRVNATAVRVPVFYGHSEAVHIETVRPITVEEVISLLEEAPGVTLMQDHDYPTAATDAVNEDAVFVGRIRADVSRENGLCLWVVADNIRKGAALNAIQIAETLIQNDFYR